MFPSQVINAEADVCPRQRGSLLRLMCVTVTGDHCCDADVSPRQKVSQASQMFCPAEFMTTRCICCSCESLCRIMSSGSGSGLANKSAVVFAIKVCVWPRAIRSAYLRHKPISDIGVFSMFAGCEIIISDYLISLGGHPLHCTCDSCYFHGETGGSDSADTNVICTLTGLLVCLLPRQVLLDLLSVSGELRPQQDHFHAWFYKGICAESSVC